METKNSSIVSPMTVLQMSLIKSAWAFVLKKQPTILNSLVRPKTITANPAIKELSAL